MNYQQTIDYLYNTLPMFARMGSAAFKKDLTNTRLLCERLGNPQQKFKSIHVGGTNGKGSVSHMLAAVLQTAGYKTGLYTSPHLYDFRERIKLDGALCEEDFVIDFVERMQPAIDEIQPSFFEITVAMAFDYFARHKVEIAVIEVGLGGRLDSTNVITPQFSIITNIGWDHMNLLGNTLEEIALEKAGIIKQDVPVIIGERQPGIDKLFEAEAAKKHSAIYFASDEHEAVAHRWNKDLFEIDVRLKEEDRVNTWKMDLPGIYQTKNLCTVLQAWELLLLDGYMISEAQFQRGIRNVKKLTGLHGRWELIHHQPTVVLEVAHNKNGIEQMLRHLEQIRFDQLHIVIGMVKDKDVDQVLRLLPAKAHYYFTQAQIPRALDAQTLRDKGSALGLQGKSYDEVNAALHHALEQATKQDLVIVCGSIFLVAEVNRNLVSDEGTGGLSRIKKK